MTREEKAKAYDEALEDMRAIYPNLKGDAKLAVEHAFPQLIESEDEKMINELQGFLDSFGADYFGTGAWQKFHDWLKNLPERFNLQPKQEWSEEDEDMLNSCISSIEEAKENRYAYKETDGDTSYDHEIAWLKSLPERFNLEPKEGWNEEDEENMQAIVETIKRHWLTLPGNTLIDWLKSLRPVSKESLQPHWKPSEERGRKRNSR